MTALPEAMAAFEVHEREFEHVLGNEPRLVKIAGDLIGEISLPGAVNFCFGGPRRNVLYITADTGVWAAVPAG